MSEHEVLWVPHKLRNFVMIENLILVIKSLFFPMGHKGLDKMYGAMKYEVYWTSICFQYSSDFFGAGWAPNTNTCLCGEDLSCAHLIYM
jgi:hypothetical protein